MNLDSIYNDLDCNAKQGDMAEAENNRLEKAEKEPEESQSELIMVPFPPSDYPLRDGKEIKTWMDGYEQCIKDYKIQTLNK